MKRNPRTRHLLAGLGLAVLMVGLVTPSSATATAPAAKKPVAGGTLTIAAQREVPTYDPVKGTVGAQSTGADRTMFVLGTLLKYNSYTGAVIPGMALGISSTDAQTWTLKLRPDVKFTDGTPYDADAVIFNINRFKDPANASPAIAQFSALASMTAPDPLTVVFKLSAPNGSFPRVLTDIGGAVGSPTQIKADRNWGAKPIGAGPFMLESWVRDQQATFVRNPNYWDKPRPYIDKIVYRIIPDATSIAQSLKAGDIDTITTGNVVALKVAQDDPKNFRAWDPDVANGSIGLACNQAVAPCNDVRYREALSLAFSPDLAKQVFLPTVQFATKGLVCPPYGKADPECNKAIKVKYDVKKASKLVQQVKADGINTDLEFFFNLDGVGGAGFGEWVQQQLAKVGINVKVLPGPQAELITRTTAHNFQSIVVYNPTALDMNGRYYNDWHSVGGTSGGRDTANLNNAQLDVALEKGRNSLKLTDRIEGMQEAQHIIQKDFLVQWIYPFVAGNVYAKKVNLPDYVSPNAYLARWDEAWLSKGS